MDLFVVQRIERSSPEQVSGKYWTCQASRGSKRSRSKRQPGGLWTFTEEMTSIGPIFRWMTVYVELFICGAVHIWNLRISSVYFACFILRVHKDCTILIV